jgi:hypothetical protein
VPFPPPPGYNRSDHALLEGVLAAAAAAGPPGRALALSDFVGLIPYAPAVAAAGRHKFMLCCGGWPVNGDAVTLSAGYVGARTPAARAAAAAAHTRYLLGALHFLASDAAVPAATRADAARYGLCGDEWAAASLSRRNARCTSASAVSRNSEPSTSRTAALLTTGIRSRRRS